MDSSPTRWFLSLRISVRLYPSIQPRRDRRKRIAPETAALSTSVGLGLPVARLDVNRRDVQITRETPGKAATHLLEVRIDAVDNDSCQSAAVPI